VQKPLAQPLTVTSFAFAVRIHKLKPGVEVGRIPGEPFLLNNKRLTNG
jgi:hypothetical protein